MHQSASRWHLFEGSHKESSYASPMMQNLGHVWPRQSPLLPSLVNSLAQGLKSVRKEKTHTVSPLPSVQLFVCPHGRIFRHIVADWSLQHRAVFPPSDSCHVNWGTGERRWVPMSHMDESLQVARVGNSSESREHRNRRGAKNLWTKINQPTARTGSHAHTRTF